MRGLVAVEIDGRPGTVRVPMPARNLLTGETVVEETALGPFGVLAAIYE